MVSSCGCVDRKMLTTTETRIHVLWYICIVRSHYAHPHVLRSTAEQVTDGSGLSAQVDAAARLDLDMWVLVCNKSTPVAVSVAYHGHTTRSCSNRPLSAPRALWLHHITVVYVYHDSSGPTVCAVSSFAPVPKSDSRSGWCMYQIPVHPHPEVGLCILTASTHVLVPNCGARYTSWRTSGQAATPCVDSTVEAGNVCSVILICVIPITLPSRSWPILCQPT